MYIYSNLRSARFVDRIVPWVHYIPIQVDLSDLHDALLFFRGDANGDGAHEYLARRIASAGREWSKQFWREEDLVSYFFR
jgi:Glycosyl transferase family 90